MVQPYLNSMNDHLFAPELTMDHRTIIMEMEESAHQSA
ncbi:hypothetical protein BMAGN_0368 [Bifidobacterium magnum]|uniref:Uncharacterized protein n=1 Tax=Bifidobacterium magnum TaxID=1692 RepID=A0A087BBK7_9BIFI|nr:hypothetical protein BMAGN_0368 [Bifidobacterium magnum]